MQAICCRFPKDAARQAADAPSSRTLPTATEATGTAPLADRPPTGVDLDHVWLVHLLLHAACGTMVPVAT